MLLIIFEYWTSFMIWNQKFQLMNWTFFNTFSILPFSAENIKIRKTSMTFILAHWHVLLPSFVLTDWYTSSYKPCWKTAICIYCLIQEKYDIAFKDEKSWLTKSTSTVGSPLERRTAIEFIRIEILVISFTNISEFHFNLDAVHHHSHLFFTHPPVR